jgi:hypothetical protein
MLNEIARADGSRLYSYFLLSSPHPLNEGRFMRRLEVERIDERPA